MDDEHRESRRKRFLNKVSKGVERLKRGLKPKDSPVDRPSSAPPNISQGSGQHLGVSPLVQSTHSLLGPGDPVIRLSGEPSEGAVNTAHGELPATLVATVPSSALEATEHVSNTQILTFVGKGIVGLLSNAAEGIPIPGVKGIFDAITKVIGAIEETKANREGFKMLEGRCQSLVDTVINPLKGKELLEIPQALRDSLERLESNLVELSHGIEKKLRMGKFGRFINHEEDVAIIKSMDDHITHCLEFYLANINTWMVGTLHQVKQTQDMMKFKQMLSPVNAGYDDRSTQTRSSCFRGTREKLITDIKAWIDHPNMDKPIYVLYGIAGIGKSTVAQTIAEYAASKNVLLASFFFSRDEGQLKSGDNFFSTLAFQMAHYDAHLATQISAALLATPDILQKQLEAQFQSLVVKPIQEAKISKAPLILVIDAFDECLPSDATNILELLRKHTQSMSHIKIFLTARPEPHIENVFVASRQLQPFYLHEIEKSVAKGDIKLFLQHALSKEQVKNTLQYIDWEPTEEDLESLAEKCGILFIMASTAVKYILDKDLSKPALQMTQLLTGLDIDDGEYGVIGYLDKLYLGILNSSIPKRGSAAYLADFQRVVGAIVVLQDLLAISSLSKLLGMEESEVQVTLQKLHSILAPGSSNQAPQLYHKSFPDFITHKKRCIDKRFYIVPQKHHAELAHLCFSIMEKDLHQDMHGFQGLQKYRSNAEMRDSLNKNITNELRYACIYWVTHLSRTENGDIGQLLGSLENFLFTNLLYWIEVLSLVGKLEMACPMMRLALLVLADKKTPNVLKLKEMLNDGSRCVTKFYEIIKTSGAHVYYSALPFMPLESLIYKTYKGTSKDVAIIIKGDIQWNPLLASLKGHSNQVITVAFTFNGTRLASSSKDKTVKLWDGLTGAHIVTLEGHSKWVRAVTFSADGTRLASGSNDKTVKLWDGLTGAHIATLKGHSGYVNTVVFSSDGTRLASGSDDKTVKLWDGITGAHITTLEGHSRHVRAVAFSPDGIRLASGSDDKTVKIWDGLTGAHIVTLEGHSNDVRTVTFSSNGTRLASCSNDKTVKLWNGFTGAHIATLEGHSGYVNTVVFSSDGTRLASGSDDTTVKLWNGFTGAHIATLKGHSDPVKTVAFSYDGIRLASGSDDKMVKLWNGLTGVQIASLEGHSSHIRAVTFSSDGTRLASCSNDKTVKLWDGLTEAHIATLEGHSRNVRTVAFSFDSTRLASGSNDKTVKLWDGLTGAHITTLNHSKWVRTVTFSSDSTRLASCSNDNTVKLWNGFTGAHIATLEGHSGYVNTVVFSSDGTRLASGSNDKMINIWDGLTGAHIAMLEGHSGYVNTIAFSPDGIRLASGSDDKTVKLWDGLTGAHIATLEVHSDPVKTVVFSSDGTILTSSDLHGIKMYCNGFTGALISTLNSPHDIYLSNPSTKADVVVPVTSLLSSTQATTNDDPDLSHSTMHELPIGHYVFTDNIIIHLPSRTPILYLPPELHGPATHALQHYSFALAVRDRRLFLLQLPQLSNFQ